MKNYLKNTRNIWVALGIIGTLSITSCDNNKDKVDPKAQLTLSATGLPDLGSDYVYEGWMMVNGKPVSTGRFTANASGALSQSTFDLEADQLNAATAFILTIEPATGDDPAPSDIHILAGDFSGNSGTMTTADSKALGTDFGTASGKFLFATPTDSLDTNENSGIWFIDNSSGSATAGLSLPALPSGWRYEGWFVINGTPVSTGIFTDPTKADESFQFSGPIAGPPFPGEDFLKNAPTGLTFPTDIRGGVAVVSVEPYPDNSPDPFVMKPLLKETAATDEVHKPIQMNANLGTIPKGTFSR